MGFFVFYVKEAFNLPRLPKDHKGELKLVDMLSLAIHVLLYCFTYNTGA